MNTSELIENARDIAPACATEISRLLEALADALEESRKRLAMADAVAYEAARADIECHAVRERWGGRTGGGNWYMVDGLRNDNGEQDLVNLAIAYLESRGLIERDAKGLVRVLDESEATS